MGKILYWVGQKLHLNFSTKRNELFGQPNTRWPDAQTGFPMQETQRGGYGSRGEGGCWKQGRGEGCPENTWALRSVQQRCSIRMFLHKYNSFTHKPMSPSLIHVKYFVSQENNKLGRKVTAVWHNQLLLRGYRVSNAMGQGSPKSMVKDCFTVFKNKYNFIMCKRGLSPKLWTTKLSFDMSVI